MLCAVVAAPASVSPPKLPEQRRRYNQPQRSEWVELPKEFERVLPNFRSSMTIPREYWNRWARDPVTTQWDEGDMVMALYLADHWDSVSEQARLSYLDRLGLNAKGRRDLRYRTATEAAAQRKAIANAAEVRRIRLVAEREAERKTAS